MNINQLTLIPGSFPVDVVNGAGETERSTVKIKINRLSFREATKKAFQEALDDVEKEPERIAQILAGYTDDEEHKPLLADWELYADDANTQKLPITVETILELPVDVVMSLSEAVFGRLFANPPKASPSGNGSAPAAQSSPASPTNSADGTSSASPAGSGG